MELNRIESAQIHGDQFQSMWIALDRIGAHRLEPSRIESTRLGAWLRLNPNLLQAARVYLILLRSAPKLVLSMKSIESAPGASKQAGFCQQIGRVDLASIGFDPTRRGLILQILLELIGAVLNVSQMARRGSNRANRLGSSNCLDSTWLEYFNLLGIGRVTQNLVGFNCLESARHGSNLRKYILIGSPSQCESIQFGLN